MECARRAICRALRPQTADSTASLCTYLKSCAMMRSNRPTAATTARKSHASRTACEDRFGVCTECARRAMREPLWRQTADSTA
eukprot:8265241-Lingulodinium_polyedra.AAC.1